MSQKRAVETAAANASSTVKLEVAMGFRYYADAADLITMGFARPASGYPGRDTQAKG